VTPSADVDSERWDVDGVDCNSNFDLSSSGEREHASAVDGSKTASNRESAARRDTTWKKGFQEPIVE